MLHTGPGSGRGRTLQLVGLTIAAGALLGALELAAALLLERWPARSGSPDTVTRTLQTLEFNPVPLVKDVDLLWRNEPLVRRTQPVNPRAFGRDDAWTLEIDSEGFRGPERGAPTAAPRPYRILCVGDSVTFGFNVDQGDIFPARLERVLRQRHPGARIEVLNAAVPGWSWLQGLRFLETRGLELRPDLVIMAHGTNDQYMTATVTDAERLRSLSRPIPRLLQSLRLELEKTHTFRAIERLLAPALGGGDLSPACSEQLKSGGLCKRVGLPEITNAVLEVQRLASASGSDLLVLNLDFLDTLAVAATRAALEQRAFWFVDFVERLTALQRAEEARLAAELDLAPARGVYDARDTYPERASWLGLVRVRVPDRERSYWIKGQNDLGPPFEIRERLYDDGSHGDERPADGVFSTRLELPKSIGALTFKFQQEEVPEFLPLPPLQSSFGDRILHPTDDFVSPVYVFGRVPYKVERTHPDAEGHALIAAEIADGLEARGSFRAFVSAAADDPRGAAQP